MSNETKRYLAADLRICKAATAGPWYKVECTHYIAGGEADVIGQADRESDQRFIVEARTGWPHAIRRALDAEKRLRTDGAINSALRVENEQLNTLLDDILDDHECSLSTRELIEEALFRW